VSSFSGTSISGVAFDPSDLTVVTSNNTNNLNSTTVIASGLSVYLYADTNGEPLPGQAPTLSATANQNTTTGAS